jgi:hypothetical protein
MGGRLMYAFTDRNERNAVCSTPENPSPLSKPNREERDICTKHLQSTVKKLYMGSISKTGAETDTKKKSIKPTDERKPQDMRKAITKKVCVR